jgi:PhnB protein
MASKTQPVPEGLHTVTPYLTCADTRKEIEFLKKAFGAEQRGPYMECPESKKVMHAEVRIGTSVVFFSDASAECGSRSHKELGGSPITLWIYVPDVDALHARATKAGATALQPPADMFWGDRMSMVQDPEGLSWAIVTHNRDLTPAQIEKERDAFFASMKA